MRTIYIKKAVYMNQLPPQVRAEARRDFYRILCMEECTEHNADFMDVIENNAMCSKVKDVCGCEEEGLLDFGKYERWM